MFDARPGQEGPTVLDYLKKNKDTYVRYAPQFQKEFSVRLWTYWDMRTGFDIVRFDDEVIKPPDGASTREAILARYGEDAVKLIEELIK